MEKGHLEMEKTILTFYIISNLTSIQNIKILALKLMKKFYVYYLVFY